jgi:hypothetical protein
MRQLRKRPLEMFLELSEKKALEQQISKLKEDKLMADSMFEQKLKEIEDLRRQLDEAKAVIMLLNKEIKRIRVLKAKSLMKRALSRDEDLPRRKDIGKKKDFNEMPLDFIINSDDSEGHIESINLTVPREFFKGTREKNPILKLLCKYSLLKKSRRRWNPKIFKSES